MNHKVGETLILDVGRGVSEWKRVRDGKEETIRYCKDEKSKECNRWIDSNRKPVGDGREHIFDNGTLIIENFKYEDFGDYFSNDELERVHYTADGHIWKLARTKITVIPV